MPFRALLMLALVTTLVAAGVVTACKSSPPPTFGDLVHIELSRLAEIVMESVPDEDRAARAGAILDEIEQAEQELLVALVDAGEETKRLEADYDATREQFAAAFERLDDTRRSARGRILPRVEQLQEVLTSEEWQAVHAGMGELNEHWDDFESWEVSR